MILYFGNGKIQNLEILHKVLTSLRIQNLEILHKGGYMYDNGTATIIGHA